MDRSFWQEKLNHLPSHPGVYLFKDETGRIIYVGKAESLKSRVTSYFQDSRNLSPKTLAMRERARDLEYILVDSPAEALLLECNLIKLYRPKYNIMLKDDKTYPYLKLTLAEDYPRLLVTRRYLNDGSKYFGPFTNAKAMHDTVAVLKKCLPLRTCGVKPGRSKDRTCLNYDLGNCPGPCMGKISKEDYLETVKKVDRFLSGDGNEIRRMLRDKMEAASENLAFEQAAVYRDQLASVDAVLSKQKISELNTKDHRDLIALCQNGDDAVITVFCVRNGRLIGREHRLVEGCGERTAAEILRAFLPEFYSGDRMIPLHIYVRELPEESSLLEEILGERRGGPVHFLVPQRGEKSRMLQLAEKNAAMLMDEEKRNKNRDDDDVRAALEHLRAALELPYTPRRIECYDISHVQGAYTVGSMIVFIDGKPKKDQYRRFKIKTVEGIDDFASLNEVLDRRFRHGMEDKKAGKTTGFADFPDLFIIDGGKGQLSATLKIKEKYNSDIPFVSLAKREEELMLPHQPESLMLPKGSPEFHLIQRIRDEAHRFAITFHRELRGKGQTRSLLADIPHIGPARQKALMKHFKTIRAIESATVEELAMVDTMNLPAAEAVYEFFRLRDHTKEQPERKSDSK
ncbi:MAG: excinuclease ABC subunit UvrC [Firmicutes bacterium]|nr:excinuclease ABC subunit UvrC [Bacillota bacterium]